MARRTRRAGAEDEPTQMEARLAALRQDLEALQDDMRGLGEGVGEAAQERLKEALRATETLAAQMEEWTSENLGTLRETIREQPMAACLVSMSVGAILGLLLLRR